VPVARFEDRDGLSFLVLDELAPFGVDAVVTTRAGGCSTGPYAALNLGLHVGDDEESVIENRSRVAAALGEELDDFVFMDQSHGTRVAVVDRSARGRGARAVEHAMVATDALVTTSSELPLVVLVADCCPIVVVDVNQRILGVAHAGWRGSAGGVAGALLETMRQLGAEPASCHALIGPSIDQARYEVGHEVAAALRGSLSTTSPGFIDGAGPRSHVDLAALNVSQLVESGIPSTQVAITPWRTDDERFFSDRAMRPCGRFALIATLAS
jgi:YfiH family protein